jgi:hypothetical protein
VGSGHVVAQRLEIISDELAQLAVVVDDQQAKPVIFGGRRSLL